jgi:ribonuclease Y
MDMILLIAVGVIGALVGFGTGFMIKRQSGQAEAAALIADAQKKLAESEKLVIEATAKAKTITKEAELAAKETIIAARSDFDRKVEERKKEIDSIEDRLLHREKTLDRKLEQTEKRERDYDEKERRLGDRERELETAKSHLARIIDQQTERLQQIAEMSTEEAKEELKERIYQDARIESANQVKKLEDQSKLEAKEKAGYIIAQAIQRQASDFVAENTVSVVDLPNDEMKGRIIGREGRNIRSIEAATGVDLIIDDTPNAIIISCFDPIKREVARRTLARLISDGRIHPGRIEGTVDKVTKEINNELREEGEKAVLELGLEGIHPEIVKTLGRLKYRTSYSQNVLHHSIEVGFLAGIMAAELGQNMKLARRAGLLHDIGKAIDQTMEGTHTQIGVELARRHNESKVVLNAIESHHEDVPATSIISVLVAAADALSASRPGARREMLQNYINRMQKLEEIGDSFAGVEKTLAIQAGREVRVVVTPDSIKDGEAFFLAKDIAKKIEGELAYPGEIKVTVIRETRVTEYAR